MKTSKAFRHRVAAKLLIAASLITLSARGQSHEAAKSLKVILDPAQTDIRWTLSGNLHATHGTFKLKTGELVFSPATGIAEGQILVDATTGQSGEATRDKHMQDEVLESNRYPAIFFHATSISGPLKPGDQPQDLSATGTFNIHGADHPLELPLKVTVSGGVVTATTHFVVPYVDWGMKNPSRMIFRVGKQVDVEVTAKGTITPAN